MTSDREAVTMIGIRSGRKRTRWTGTCSAGPIEPHPQAGWGDARGGPTLVNELSMKFIRLYCLQRNVQTAYGID